MPDVDQNILSLTGWGIHRAYNHRIASLINHHIIFLSFPQKKVTMTKLLPSMARLFLLYSSTSIICLVHSFHATSYNTFLQTLAETNVWKLHAKSDNNDTTNSNRTVTILSRGPNHIVALKPPSVVCHHSGWTGSRSKAKRGEEPEIPMLQRVRDGIHDIDSRDGDEEKPKRKVNLVHRLDRGASGALLLAFADDNDVDKGGKSSKKGATASLSDALASPESIKTYVALVRGEGILREEDFKEKGWFEFSKPIKDENGEVKNATTLFNFVAGQPETCEDGVDRPRISLVLARPKQGRWHQIRKHLQSGLSHPILGDTTHVRVCNIFLASFGLFIIVPLTFLAGSIHTVRRVHHR